MVSVQIDRTECWLEFARAHTGMLNFLCFSVYSCRTSEIFTLVELLSRTLLADNCLVARYEPGKEPSVSVCHNSKILVNSGRTNALPVTATIHRRIHHYHMYYLRQHQAQTGKPWSLPMPSVLSS